MSLLHPTPPERLLDGSGRPYFLWDCETDLAAFERALRDPDPDVRAYFVAKLMRQAKPDDVFGFVTLTEIGSLWSRLTRHLGRTRPFWTWLLRRWGVVDAAR